MKRLFSLTREGEVEIAAVSADPDLETVVAKLSVDILDAGGHIVDFEYNSLRFRCGDSSLGPLNVVEKGRIVLRPLSSSATSRDTSSATVGGMSARYHVRLRDVTWGVPLLMLAACGSQVVAGHRSGGWVPTLVFAGVGIGFIAAVALLNERIVMWRFRRFLRRSLRKACGVEQRLGDRVAGARACGATRGTGG